MSNILYMAVSIVIFISILFLTKTYRSKIEEHTGTISDVFEKVCYLLLAGFYSAMWPVTVPATALVVALMVLGNYIFKDEV